MFDEQEAILFIRNRLDPEIANRYSDDELLNVIDMIWDYYEANGMLDVDLSDDDDDDETPSELLASLVEYASRMLRKDKHAVMDPAHLEPIIAAELAYEEKISDEL